MAIAVAFAVFDLRTTSHSGQKTGCVAASSATSQTLKRESVSVSLLFSLFVRPPKMHVETVVTQDLKMNIIINRSQSEK